MLQEFERNLAAMFQTKNGDSQKIKKASSRCIAFLFAIYKSFLNCLKFLVRLIV